MKVYIADVKSLLDPEKYEAAYKTVDEKRKQKIDRFLCEKDKLLSLGAGLLLRKALLNEGISDAEIEQLPGGKPYLKNHEDVFFSLSHSGTSVMCVIADVPVGCDIEEIRKPPAAVVKRLFSAREQNVFLGLENDAQAEYFYTLWTARESYLKMTGEGLRGMKNDLSISLPLGCQSLRASMVTFFEVQCEGAYKAAVCASGCLRVKRFCPQPIPVF